MRFALLTPPGQNMARHLYNFSASQRMVAQTNLKKPRESAVA
jgi:hypothetical protein